jgi:hypothetical protein
MGLFSILNGSKPAFGTPPFSDPHGQTGGAEIPTTPGTLPVKHGLAGFLDRMLNPTNALGQFGQALMASSGGPVGDAMAYMIKARELNARQQPKGPHFEHIGDSYGIVDDNTGQFTPTYTAPHQDTGYRRELADAGIDPDSEEGRGLMQTHARNLADPITSIPLPGGSSYIGPRSGLASVLGGGPSSAPLEPPPADLPPAGGVAPLDAITSQAESGGRNYYPGGLAVTSPKGAKYAMQVMPATARNPGFGIAPALSDSPAEYNRVGHDYLAAMRQRYGGDMAKAWAAYNAGPGRVDASIASRGADWQSSMPSETRSYVASNLKALGTSPTKVVSEAEYNALPSGTMFIAPDGKRRVKP